MLKLKNLTESDCDFILQHWVGKSSIFRSNLGKNELLTMIQEINTKKYKGNYYEMFGIVQDNVLVGIISYYQRETDIVENAISFGIEIEEKNRIKGFGTRAVLMSFVIMKEKGYKKIFSQTRTDNIASVNLHTKCGFEIIEKIVNSRGNEVYNFVKVL